MIPVIAIELDRIRHLRLTPNALADAETITGLGIAAMVGVDRIGFRSIRALLWAGLKWEDRALTIEKAGDLMEIWREHGKTLEQLGDLIVSALEESGWFPEIQKVLGGGEKNGE